VVYVGSLNLDPRSRELNTEIDLLLENSWAVSLNEDNDVVWRAADEELTSTPARNFW